MTDTLASRFIAIATEHPQKAALRWTGGEISFEGLLDLAKAAARHMQGRGVLPNSLVALDCNNWVTAYALMLGTALLGASWVEARPDLLSHGINVTHYLFTDPARAVTHPRAFAVDRSWQTLPKGAPTGFEALEGPISVDSPWCIARSSGTTGTPKYMSISYGLQLRRFETVWRFPSNSVACAFPPLSLVGAGAPLALLLNGATIVIANTIEALQALGAHQLVASPGQVDAMVREAGPVSTKIPVLGSGGGMVTRRALEAWLEVFDCVNVGYGSSEASVVAASIIRDAGSADTSESMILPGVSVEIVDDAGQGLADGTPGLVRVKTPVMISSYINNADLTESHFRNGWFYPGDIGIISDGRIRIVGRASEQFDVGGIKVNPVQVDEAARGIPGINAVMAFPEMGAGGVAHLALLVHADTGQNPKALAAAIREATGRIRLSALVPQAIYFVSALPYNESGKLMRQQGEQAKGNAAAY
jgi:acyl-coenzyme A synthetase/AMP-(fatty) acid ligase